MDILSNLPVEISLEIFKYLSGEDLAKCSMVSHKWRNVVNNNVLWRRLCLLEGFEVDDMLVTKPSDNAFGLSPQCEYKKMFADHGSVLQKWRENNYHIFDLKDVIGTAYFDNDTVLAVMYWDGCIDVFKLKRVPQIIQSIPSVIPGVPFAFAGRSEEFVIFRCDRILMCYEWYEGMLHFSMALYAVVNVQGVIEIHSATNVDLLFYLTAYKDACWDVKAVFENTVVLYVRPEWTVHFWSLRDSECTGVISHVHNPKCSAYKEHLYMYESNEISAYNVYAEKLFSLRINVFKYNVRHVDLLVNDCVILAVLNCSEGYSVLKAWDRNLRKLIEIEEQLQGVILHPKLPAIIYLSRNKRSRCTCKILMRNLRDLTVLWERPLPSCQLLGTMTEEFAYLSIIKDRYLLCIPRNNSCSMSNERILFNIKNGRQFYHFVTDEQCIVKYSNNKLIEINLYGLSYYVATRIILYI